MMVRNPFRRPWDPIGQCFLLESKNTPFRRVLWAARHACKQLRAERDAAIEEGHQVVEALQGDPEPLPDSYYSVAVAVRELRMMLAKSEAESAEFRAHAWSEQEKLQQRLTEVELHRDLLAEMQANLALELRTTQGRLAGSQQENVRLREALETAIERLDEDAQWSGHRNVACHCHPEYALSCPSCGALAPDHVQLSHLARSPSGEHEDGCEFVGMMNELRAALAGKKGRDDG